MSLFAIAAIVVLVGASAFFSGSEIAVFSLEEHRLGSLTDERGGDTLLRLREDPHRLLVTLLIGNNFVNVAIASLTTALLVERFTSGTGILLATLVASTVVLVFGEIVPKSYGVANPERVALRIAGPVQLLQRILYPVVWLFETVTAAINRVTGGGRDIERPYVTREEIVSLLGAARAQGVIGSQEQTMLQRVFRFSTTAVGSVMVPRTDVIAVDASASVEAAIDACAEARLTRLPIYEGGLDRIVGYVDVRDLVDAPTDADLRDIAHPTVAVFESREIDEVLAKLQESRTELAIVYDEFGAVEGLVTTENIVEQIVGEIFDIGEERPIVVLSPTTATVRGTAATEQINAELNTHLPADGDTVAGLLSETLGRVPNPGDVVDIADAHLTVRTVENNRVRRVHVEAKPESNDPT